MWGVINPIPGVAAAAPMVSVGRATIRISEIHFATPLHGNNNWHYLYESSNTHSDAPGNLQWWAAGTKIASPEWGDNGNRNWRSCWTRNNPIAMRVKLIATTAGSVSGTLEVTPKLDGSTAHLTPASVPFTYPAGAAEHWVNIQPGGALPNEVGRYILALQWSITAGTVTFAGPNLTRHYIYGIYRQPLDPEYDSASPADTGAGHLTTRDQGTLTGTRKRLDHMMRLIGGSDRRHPVASQNDLIDMYWQLHKGINDTPGAPPYFNGVNSEVLTTGPDSSGTALSVEDNWLAFCPTSSPHWNDASCIGHVQLAKTMLAAVGLFSRRTWVFPHTTRLPDGTTVSFADSDYYCLGNHDASKKQSWTFTHNARSYVATPYLMEPESSWEYFEACMLSPSGKFLTGGYNTSSNPASFRANKGFNSAAELLRWWCNTSRPGFGRRFMCWIYDNEGTGETHCWDVDGRHYDFANYVQIRDRGKHLPPP
jgi:hypothetical protein